MEGLIRAGGKVPGERGTLYGRVDRDEVAAYAPRAGGGSS